MACILTFPPYQRKGYGKFLISFCASPACAAAARNGRRLLTPAGVLWQLTS